jgi:hypothetical protein
VRTSEGWVEYEIPDGTKFRMSFSRLTGDNGNKASIICSEPSSSQCAPNDVTNPPSRNAYAGFSPVSER